MIVSTNICSFRDFFFFSFPTLGLKVQAACDFRRDERKPNISESLSTREVKLHQTNQASSGMRSHTSPNESATSQSYKEDAFV